MSDDKNTHNNNNNTFSPQENKPSFSCFKILFISLEFFPRNKQIFLTIFTLTTLPLSFLLFYLSLSARPIKTHIYHLEALLHFAPTRFEAKHVWEESREDAISLLYLRLFYFLPSYLLSLLAAITAVHSAHFAAIGKRSNLHTAFTSVKLTWQRTLVTTICIYALLVLYAQVLYLFSIVSITTHELRILLWVLGSGVEVYLMAVLGVGLVVSVLEDKFGFDAIRIGSKIMERRRVCGWVLSGWFVLISSVIGWTWERSVMDGEDSVKNGEWTAVMGSWKKMGLICLYGIEVLWSYVVVTIFYCECRKGHVIRCGEIDSNGGAVGAV